MALDTDEARGCFDNLVDYLSEKPGWLAKAYAVVVLLLLVLLGALCCLGFLIAQSEPSRAPVNYTRAHGGFVAKQPVGWFNQYGTFRITEYYVSFDLSRRFDSNDAHYACGARGAGWNLLTVENADEQQFVLHLLNDIIANEYKGWRYKGMFTFWTAGMLIREATKYSLHWNLDAQRRAMPFANLCPDWHWPAAETGVFPLTLPFDAYPEWSHQFGCWMPVPLAKSGEDHLFICKADRYKDALDTSRFFFSHPKQYEDDGTKLLAVFLKQFG